MTTKLTSIATDFYTKDGFLISITIPSHPHVGDTVVMNAEMYKVTAISWDFDAGGLPLLVRVNLE